jgi:hypothetical protein
MTYAQGMAHGEDVLAQKDFRGNVNTAKTLGGLHPDYCYILLVFPYHHLSNSLPALKGTDNYLGTCPATTGDDMGVGGDMSITIQQYAGSQAAAGLNGNYSIGHHVQALLA